MDKDHPEYEMTEEQWRRYEHRLIGKCWICGDRALSDRQGKCNFCNGSWITEENLRSYYG
jgi:hypothetical protein